MKMCAWNQTDKHRPTMDVPQPNQASHSIRVDRGTLILEKCIQCQYETKTMAGPDSQSRIDNKGLTTCVYAYQKCPSVDSSVLCICPLYSTIGLPQPSCTIKYFNRNIWINRRVHFVDIDIAHTHTYTHMHTYRHVHTYTHVCMCILFVSMDIYIHYNLFPYLMESSFSKI